MVSEVPNKILAQCLCQHKHKMVTGICPYSLIWGPHHYVSISAKAIGVSN